MKYARTKKGAAGKMALRLKNAHFSISLSCEYNDPHGCIITVTNTIQRRSYSPGVTLGSQYRKCICMNKNVLKASRNSILPGSRVWRAGFEAVSKYEQKPRVE